MLRQNFPQPRPHYEFEDMKCDEVKSIAIPDDDPMAGVRARCAAYAFGRRNGWQFCGAVNREKGQKWMLIRRVT